MSAFLQAIPDNGFIIHAVPADRRRAGVWGQIIHGPTVCRKVRGRDSQAYPNLRLQFSDWANDKETAKPFSRNADDFEITTWGARKICPDCCRVIDNKKVNA